MDLRQLAMNAIFGKANYQSPVPQANVLNTNDKMNLYKQTAQQLQQAQQANPGLSFNRDDLTNYAMQNGGLNNAILGNMATQQAYDKNAKLALAQPTPQPTAMPTATPTPNPIQQIASNILKGAQTAISDLRPQQQAQTPQDPNQLVTPIFKQYGIAPQVALAVKQAEGGQRNAWDIGANDSNPNGAPVVTDPAAAATLAAKAMRKLLDAQHITSTDPNVQLNALEKHYAGDPATWKKRSIEQGGAGKYFNSWADFVKATSNWKKYSN